MGAFPIKEQKVAQQHSGGDMLDPASPNVLDGQVRRPRSQVMTPPSSRPQPPVAYISSLMIADSPAPFVLFVMLRWPTTDRLFRSY